MEYDEASQLIVRTASQLSIEPLIGELEKTAIFEQSNGHPYVIKIMLGVIADERKFVKPANIIARKDEILDALFERTFVTLSPVAARIFLTLSSWRSLVPQPAVEAVLLRHADEECDPEGGIDQLLRLSLIERTAADDGTDFLEVPLTAALFGKRKLTVSPIKTIVEGDLRFLQDIGATTKAGLKEGLGPKIEIFFRRMAGKLSDGVIEFKELKPMLEFLARRHPPSWLQLATLEEERREPNWLKNSAEYIRRYLETRPSEIHAEGAWRQLLSLYRTEGDAIAGCSAFLKLSEASDPPYSEISDVANWLNKDEKLRKLFDVAERRLFLQPLINLMERRIAEASATDLSRLAWLHLISGNEPRAMELAQQGLRQDLSNVHCKRLIEKLNSSHEVSKPRTTRNIF